MENDPFEDVFPIENGDFPLLCLITGVYRVSDMSGGSFSWLYNRDLLISCLYGSISSPMPIQPRCP